MATIQRPSALARTVKILLLLAVILTGSAACIKEPPPLLRIGTNVWSGYEPLYLARDLGYLHDTPVRLIELTSATEVMRAFLNGTIDAAALTLDETIQLLSIASDVRIVLIMDVSHGADVILAQPEIADLKGLKGRRVGVESTALGAFLLTRALQGAGMKLTDISPVMLDQNAHEAAFRERSVDAVVTFEPTKTKILAVGGRQIFDSRHIPDEIVDVLVVRETFANKNKKTVQSVIANWFRALDYMKKDPVQAAAIMAPREGISTKDLLAAFDGLRFPDLNDNIKILRRKSSPLHATAEKHVKLMHDNGLISSRPDTSALLDGSYLP